MSDRASSAEVIGIHPEALRLLGGPAMVVPQPKGSHPAALGITLRYRAVERLSEFLQASAPQVMSLIEVNERTAQRRKEQGVLSADESDRLARMARVTQRAVDALGSAELAREWLRRPSRALRGMEPLALLGTDAGAELVTDELGRIEYGELY